MLSDTLRPFISQKIEVLLLKVTENELRSQGYGYGAKYILPDSEL
jgi:hypothetical protein